MSRKNKNENPVTVNNRIDVHINPVISPSINQRPIATAHANANATAYATNRRPTTGSGWMGTGYDSEGESAGAI